MVQFQDCATCVSLTSQCLELKEEICRLTKQLDNLINALHGGKEDVHVNMYHHQIHLAPKQILLQALPLLVPYLRKKLKYKLKLGW